MIFLLKYVTTNHTRDPRKAYQKLSTVKPSMIEAVNQNKPAFITNVNKPKVIRLIGKAKIKRIGLTKKPIKASIIDVIIAGYIPAMDIPVIYSPKISNVSAIKSNLVITTIICSY